MPDPETAETTKYVLASIPGLLTGGIAMVVAFVNRRPNPRLAEEQVDRDLRINQATLVHTERAAAYGHLDEWITRVTERADDICFGAALENLQEHERTEYGVCVAMHRDVLRPPSRRYLWSLEVAQQVRELQDQAVTMAHMVVLKGLGPDDEHGHDELDAIAERLRQAMSDHLESHNRSGVSVPRPRRVGRRKNREKVDPGLPQ